MPTKDELIRENEELRLRLMHAEWWMRRQVQEASHMIELHETRKENRRHFENLLEEDLIDTLKRRMCEYFGESLKWAPRYTEERLMDAEIYWITLQKHPTIDAFPVIASYQKILDAFFEEMVTMGFREKYSTLHIPHVERWLEHDIASVLSRDYTLSLGRWYQFIMSVHHGERLGYFSVLLADSIKKEKPRLASIIFSDDFLHRFETLIDMEVFGRKRHDQKISYTDARRVREILVGNYEKEGLFRLLFSTHSSLLTMCTLISKSIR